MIALPVLWPVLFAALALLPGRLGALAWRTLPLASLPALLVALLPASQGAWPSLLLGLRLEADPMARALLLLIGLAWSASAWFAIDSIALRRPRFALFWCVTLAGLCQSALAADLVGFYLGYVTMTVAAYGLVVHSLEAAAVRAGRVYLVMAFLGEAMVLSGLLLLGTPYGNVRLEALPTNLALQPAPLAGALLLGGFAVKIGVVPLHLWLPLAHPVAPVPASAILSGVIVKAGLLGALRLVPGEAFGSDLPLFSLLALGLFTAFYAVAAGLGQTRAKTVLAYSTVSQMGLLFCGLALAMYEPSARTLLPLLVLHHGLNKAALFLAMGCGAGATPWRQALLALPALSLAGAPLTGGALAKAGLKQAFDTAALPGGVTVLLSLSSLATALLMLRLMALVRAETGRSEALHGAWPLLVVLGLVVPWTMAERIGLAGWPSAAAWFDGLWPLLLALALFGAWQRLGRSGMEVPEGDLLQPLSRLIAGISRVLLRPTMVVDWRMPEDLPARMEPLMRRGESALMTLPVAGLLMLALVLLLRWVLG